MLQNPCKTLGFKKNMVYKIPPGGGGKPYPASGLRCSMYIRGLISRNRPRQFRLGVIHEKKNNAIPPGSDR